MVFKLLHELSASELRTELKRVGIQGKFVKAQAIVRLSTHLMDVSETSCDISSYWYIIS